MTEKIQQSPRMVFVAARRGLGAGALAAACAARVARDGDPAALADLRSRPHPVFAQNPRADAAPFRIPKLNGQAALAHADFAKNEIAIALTDSFAQADSRSDPSDPAQPAPSDPAQPAPSESARPVPSESAPSQAAAIVFTYAARDLAAARLAAERFRKNKIRFACVAVHTPPHFPFLPELRTRAAQALGDARVIEAPEFFPPQLAADSLAGQPCHDPALAQAVDKLARLANPDLQDSGGDPAQIPGGVDMGQAVAAVRRELADVV